MPDFDQYGHCVVCHRNLIFEQVIDQQIARRFSPDYAETEYLLDDGSKMRVCVCKQCNGNLTESKNEYIMHCVKEGWKEELKTLNWSEEKKKNYLDNYSKREIVCMSQDVPKDILAKRHKEFKLKKEGKDGNNH